MFSPKIPGIHTSLLLDAVIAGRFLGVVLMFGQSLAMQTFAGYIW